MPREKLNIKAADIEPTRLSKEERLLVAVFERALRDYLITSVNIGLKDKRSARYYFRSQHCPSTYATFSHFCEVFDLDFPSALEIINNSKTSDMVNELRNGFVLNRIGSKL